jgi:DNA-binding transcriptional MerR regulator
LIYTAGRSSANYRLFDEDALWCVSWIGNLRSLGLTVAEIHDLAAVYSEAADLPVGPHLAERLTTARDRLDTRIAELAQMRDRIDNFRSTHRAELAGDGGIVWLDGDPRLRRESA